MASINIAWILIFLGIWKIAEIILLVINESKKLERREREKKNILFPFTK